MVNDLPTGMLEKQIAWESVNKFLYEHLIEQNKHYELHNMLLTIGSKQAKIQLLLAELRKDLDRSVHHELECYECEESFQQNLEELYTREYQLLLEYESYRQYFLRKYYEKRGLLDHLIELKTDIVNDLRKMQEALKSNEHSKPKEHTDDYFLKPGYKLKKVVKNSTFPTSIAFDEKGAMYIAESGFAYGLEPRSGRVLKIANGKAEQVATNLPGPLTGITWHKNDLFVAIGNLGNEDRYGCGQIIRISSDGTKKVIVANLKTCGDHFTGDIVVGPDQKLYFGVGTATNSGVVGLDNQSWLKSHPNFHDTPARDYILTEETFLTKNPLSTNDRFAVTKPFNAFDHFKSSYIEGDLHANGVIYQCDLNGGNLRVIGDGFRNPFGIQFSPFNKQLYITDNGADPRGSRQIHEDWDNLWKLKVNESNQWHGWPDFYSGLPVTLPHFHVKNKPKPAFVIKNHPPLSSQPIARFETHSSSNKFDFSTSEHFGFVGDMFVAQLGDMSIGDNKRRTGFKVVIVNEKSGQISNFYVNYRGEKISNGPIRPIEAKFSPNGKDLYIVDFGILGSSHEEKPKRGTGGIWKVTRE